MSDSAYQVFTSELEQIVWIAEEIQRKMSNGIHPSQIAVIARKHASLLEVVKIFGYLNIPISYERGENILEKPYIQQIIIILRFIQSLNQAGESEFQQYLPAILSFPFWEIPSLEFYRLSRQAYTSQQSWLELMQAPEANPKLQTLAAFLLDLGQQAKTCTVEEVLDLILGVALQKALPQNEDEDEPDQIINSSFKADDDQKLTFVSPFKQYYFSRPYQENRADYLVFLSGLKVFFGAIRDYRSSEALSVDDVLEYVDLMQANKLKLIDNSSFNQQQDAVCLLTAHKSKGLEFEAVFVINCIEKEWQSRPLVNKIAFPSNLALLPESENTDDNLRLFFVAMTRAKRQLTLTGYRYNQDRKEIERLSFIPAVLVEDWEQRQINPVQVEQVAAADLGVDKILSPVNREQSPASVSPDKMVALETWLHSNLIQHRLSLDEKAFLKPILERYQLSVTHLNNFLDVTTGGPRKFLEQNLLHFPQSKNPSGSYGTAMHAAMAEFYTEFTRSLVLPDLEFLQDHFEKSLRKQRLNAKNLHDFLRQGRRHLALYYYAKHDSFRPNHRVEVDFAYQGVQLGEASITGKIDKMCPNETTHEYLVVDFKTGKPADSWSGKTPEEKLKLDRYHRQLVFYKILVEQSRDFAQYQVNQGCLEFLDAAKGNDEIKSLSTTITASEGVELGSLIEVVHRKIITLNFPDTSTYKSDISGVQAFIQDLLEDRV